MLCQMGTGKVADVLVQQQIVNRKIHREALVSKHSLFPGLLLYEKAMLDVLLECQARIWGGGRSVVFVVQTRQQ